MPGSVGVRILACMLMMGSLLILGQSVGRGGESMLHAGLAAIGMSAAIGLWLQRRWGAVLFLLLGTIAFGTWTRSLGFHEVLDVLVVPSMAVIYAVVGWYALNRTCSGREARALEEKDASFRGTVRDGSAHG